jgi:hypothetical protein
MTDRIIIPRLVGTRDAANRLVQEANLSDDLQDAPVFLQARALVTSTISFSDQLIKQLEAHNAGSIVLVAGTKTFEQQLRDSSSRNGHLPVRHAEPSDSLSA